MRELRKGARSAAPIIRGIGERFFRGGGSGERFLKLVTENRS